MRIDSHAEEYDQLVLLTPDEAARLLRLSKASIYRLVGMRSLPFYRVSGSLRFAKSDLDEYLAQGRVESILSRRR